MIFKMDKQEIIIGKYTLESLTNGMYASPNCGAKLKKARVRK